MPKVKLDVAKADGWGVYGYMVHSLKEREKGNFAVSRKSIHHSSSWEKSEEQTIGYAEKYSTSFWACLVYFGVPMKRPEFGDLRNKGFIGFSVGNKPFQRFEKPLLLFDALKEVERQLNGYDSYNEYEKESKAKQ